MPNDGDVIDYAVAVIFVQPFGVPTNVDRLPALVISAGLLSQAETGAERSLSQSKEFGGDGTRGLEGRANALCSGGVLVVARGTELQGEPCTELESVTATGRDSVPTEKNRCERYSSAVKFEPYYLNSGSESVPDGNSNRPG